MKNPWNFGDEAERQETITEVKIAMEVVEVLKKHDMEVHDSLTILAKIMVGLIISGIKQEGRVPVFNAIGAYMLSLLKRTYPDES